MKKFAYLLFASIISFLSASAQIGSENPFNQSSTSSASSSDGINTSNRFNKTDVASKTPAPPANPVNMPLDGGLALLLGAGALYGRKKLINKPV